MGDIQQYLSGDYFKIRFGLRRFKIPARGRQDLILDRMKTKGRFYEEGLLAALKKSMARTNGIAIDCGANIGNHSLFFASIMDLKVISFEPIPGNSAILTDLIRVNGLAEKITHVPMALGNTEGNISLGLSNENNPGMYSAGETHNAIEVAITTLDKYIADNKVAVRDVRLIKIDVEGHEMCVIDGAKQLLTQGSSTVVIELAGIAAFDEMQRKLASYDYAAKSIHCATPTVIFHKGRQNVEILEQIRKKQNEYSKKKGLLH